MEFHFGSVLLTAVLSGRPGCCSLGIRSIVCVCVCVWIAMMDSVVVN